MEDNSQKTKRIAKNTLYMFVRMLLVLCVGLYSSRVVLETLGVEDFGVYNVVGSVVVFFAFLRGALTNATYRFLAVDIGKNSDNLPETFSMAVNAHLILVLIVVVLCETIGLWFLNTQLVIPEGREFAANVAYQFSILCFVVSILQTPYNSAIIVHERMAFFAYTSIVEVVMKLLIIFLLIYLPFDKLISYAALVFAVSVLMLLCYFLYCQHYFRECIYKKVWNKEKLKEMVSFSGWSIVVNAVDVGVNQSIVFFFNVFFGVVANAALGVANQVNAQLNNLLASFTQAFNPQIMKSYASSDRQYFMKLIFSSSKFSYYLLLLASVPIMLNIDFILNLWLKNPPEGTSTFVIMVIAYSLVDAYSAPLWIGVYATGILKTHQLLMSSIKILNIPLAYLLLKYGCPATSALMLKVLLNIVCSVVRPCYVKSLFGLPLKDYFLRVLCVLLFVTIVVIPVPIYLSTIYSNPILKLFVTSLSFYAVALPIIYFYGFNKIERKKLIDMVPKPIKRIFKHESSLV